MEYDNCERFTVDVPALPFVNAAVVDKERGMLYWDAVYPHTILVTQLKFTHKLHRWVESIASIATCQHGLPEYMVLRKPPRHEERERFVNARLLATDALVAWALTTMVTNQTKPAIRRMAFEWVTKLCEYAIQAYLSNMRELDATCFFYICMFRCAPPHV